MLHANKQLVNSKNWSLYQSVTNFLKTIVTNVFEKTLGNTLE